MSEIRVNTIANADGTSAPTMTYGFQVPTGMGITGAGGINITGVCTAGIVTATNLYGTLNGNATGLTGTPNISCGTIAGSTGTFSGAVNVDATTDSTSTSTGALIVDGGLAVAKNVYVGAGMSIAGTLTYEDATNIDAVGLVTAQSGIRVPGGELTVGVAYSVGAAGVATALGLVAGASGLTVNGAASVTSGGEFKVGTGVTIASTSGVSTFSANVTFTGDGGKSCVWNRGNGAFELDDDALIKIGDGADLRLYHDGSNSYVEGSGTGELRIRGRSVRITDHDGSENFGVFNDDGAVDLYFDNSKKFATTNEGIQVTGFTSTTAGLGVTGGMWEGAFIKAGKLTDNKTLGISTSNIFVFTTQESTTGTPNIVWNDTYALSSKMKVGDSVTVTVITTAAAGGYCANWTIDGTAVTEQWNGGSAPSAGGDDGYDIYTLTLVRKATGTGDTGWLCFANVSNFT